MSLSHTVYIVAGLSYTVYIIVVKGGAHMADLEVLIVPAYIDVDPSVTSADQRTWQAVTPQFTQALSPFANLFAYGDSFHAARKALAQVIYLTAQTTDFAAIDAVRILATTRKTFPAADLEAQP